MKTRSQTTEANKLRRSERRRLRLAKARARRDGRELLENVRLRELEILRAAYARHLSEPDEFSHQAAEAAALQATS